MTLVWILMDMDDRTHTGAGRTSIRFRPMTEHTPTLPPPSTRQTAWARARNIAGAMSLTRIQSIVATLARITSLVGAVYSVAQFAGPGRTGALVATVHAAGSPQGITGATVEVLTTENTLVATLTPDSAG